MEKVKQTRILECRETTHNVWASRIGSLWCPFSFECVSLSFSSWSASYLSLWTHDHPGWRTKDEGWRKGCEIPLPLGEQQKWRPSGAGGCLGSVCEHSQGNGPPPAWATCPSFPPSLWCCPVVPICPWPPSRVSLLVPRPWLDSDSHHGLQPHLQHKSLSLRWPVKILGAEEESRKRERKREEGRRDGRKEGSWVMIGKLPGRI